MGKDEAVLTKLQPPKFDALVAIRKRRKLFNVDANISN